MSIDTTETAATTVTIPSYLRSKQHWVVRKGKEPVNMITGVKSGWDNPNAWASYDKALKIFQEESNKYSGIGYISYDDEPDPENRIICIDLDQCRDPETGFTSKWAEDILKKLDLPYGTSISECGYRAFCLGKLPENIVSGHGPQDLPPEVIRHILDRKPDAEVFNGIEVHQGIGKDGKPGVKHLTITNTWPEFPGELENRTPQLAEICQPFMKGVIESETTKNTSNTIINESSHKTGSLPPLLITAVIDTSGFTQSGDELVGPHPIFGSTIGHNFTVNVAENTWYCHHVGDDWGQVGADSWLWIAGESGALPWKDCKKGALTDPVAVEKCKEYVLKKGYLTEEVLWPERKALNDARLVVEKAKTESLNDPGAPFKEEVIEALATCVYLKDDVTYERFKGALKGKIDSRKLDRRVKEQVSKIKSKNNRIVRLSDQKSYILFDEEGKKKPELLMNTLIEDIVGDLHICVMSDTQKDLSSYDNESGKYKTGNVVFRRALTEAKNRIIASGDPELTLMGTHAISTITQLLPTSAKEVRMEDFETQTGLLCAGNGVVDMKTGELKGWSPDYFMTARTPVEYHVEVSWEDLALTWYHALQVTFDGDIDRMEYFQRAIGYCATGETQEDAAFVLIGIGGTGKSTLIDTVRDALGEYAWIIKADLQSKSGSSSISDGLAKSKYARLLIMQELDKRNQLSWGRIKELSSNSAKIESRGLYCPTENIKNKRKLVFDTNFMPVAEEPDASIMRRLKPIPFRHKFTEEEKRPETFSHLGNELEGVLLWIVEGAKKWYESGLGNPDFITQELAAYEVNMDKRMVSTWFNQSGYEIDLKNPILEKEHWIRTTEIFNEYRLFATANITEPMTIEEFSGFMINQGARKEQKSRTTVKEDKTTQRERAVFWLNVRKTDGAKNDLLAIKSG